MLSKVKGVIAQMIGLYDVDILENANILSKAMQEEIKLCSNIYRNKAPWLTEDSCAEPLRSTNIAAQISSDIARMVTVEADIGITNDDSLNNDFIAGISDLRQITEWGLAECGIILKPYRDQETVRVEPVRMTDVIITKKNTENEIIGAIFLDYCTFEKERYVKLEQHELMENTNTYTIKNEVFLYDEKEKKPKIKVALDKVDQWAVLAEEATFNNLDFPLFAYYCPAVANNIDCRSPVGISIFSRAKGQIEDLDKVYSSFMWEMEGSELAVEVDKDILDVDEFGRIKMSKREERLYRAMNNATGIDGHSFINTYSPTIREQNYINSMNEIKREIEDKVGLARGTYSAKESRSGNYMTATELKTTEQRTASTISDNQNDLEKALKHLAYAMQVFKYMGRPQKELEFVFDWDDSIVKDKQSEFERKMLFVSHGMLKPEIVLAEYFGVSEEEAKKMIPELDDTVIYDRF